MIAHSGHPLYATPSYFAEGAHISRSAVTKGVPAAASGTSVPDPLGDAERRKLPDVLKTAEVARLVGFSRRTITTLANAGTLRGFRHVSPRGIESGNDWRFFPEDVAKAFSLPLAELQRLWISRAWRPERQTKAGD